MCGTVHFSQGVVCNVLYIQYSTVQYRMGQIGRLASALGPISLRSPPIPARYWRRMGRSGNDHVRFGDGKRDGEGRGDGGWTDGG